MKHEDSYIVVKEFTANGKKTREVIATGVTKQGFIDAYTEKGCVMRGGENPRFEDIYSGDVFKIERGGLNSFADGGAIRGDFSESRTTDIYESQYFQTTQVSDRVSVEYSGRYDVAYISSEINHKDENLSDETFYITALGVSKLHSILGKLVELLIDTKEKDFSETRKTDKIESKGLGEIVTNEIIVEYFAETETINIESLVRYEDDYLIKSGSAYFSIGGVFKLYSILENLMNFFVYGRKMNDGGEVNEIREMDIQIAKTILMQLGGTARLQMFTGAYNFVALPHGVSFRIKNRRVNYVKIVLNLMDTYDVEFGLIRGANYKVVKELNGIYNDQLVDVFTRYTGMVLRLRDGGAIQGEENSEMAMNQNLQIRHHTEELEEILKSGKEVPAWVVSKLSRAADSMSDATHYLEGTPDKMARGGNTRILYGSKLKTYVVFYYPVYSQLPQKVKRKVVYAESEKDAISQLPKKASIIAIKDASGGYRGTSQRIEELEALVKAQNRRKPSLSQQIRNEIKALKEMLPLLEGKDKKQVQDEIENLKDRLDEMRAEGQYAEGGGVGKDILDKEFWEDIAHLWRTRHIDIDKNGNWYNTEKYKGVNNTSGLYFTNESANLIVGLANSYNVTLLDIKNNNPNYTAFDYDKKRIEEFRNKEYANGGGVGEIRGGIRYVKGKELEWHSIMSFDIADYGEKEAERKAYNYIQESIKYWNGELNENDFIVRKSKDGKDYKGSYVVYRQFPKYAEGGEVGSILIYNGDDVVYSSKNLLLAKLWVIKNWKKYDELIVMDSYGDSIVITKEDKLKDIDFLFNPEPEPEPEPHFNIEQLKGEIEALKELLPFLEGDDKKEIEEQIDILNITLMQNDNFGGGAEKEEIKQWYRINYPDDDLGNELNDAVTFEDLWNVLHNGSDVYEIIGVGNSDIRKNLFWRLSEIYGVDYNHLYLKWLNSDEPDAPMLVPTPTPRYAEGGGVGNFPPKGELKNKENLLLKYEKIGSDYEFFVYKPEKKDVSSYEQIKYVCVNKDCPTRMSYNQFLNYLYAETYLDDRKYANGGGVGEPYDSMTKYQLEKELNKINDEVFFLYKKYGNYEAEEIGQKQAEADKIITLLYGVNFSGVGQKFKYAKGGGVGTHIDLFEDYENMPPKIAKIFDKYSEDFEDGNYKGLYMALKEMQQLGYTFEYYLDGQAYGLRPIGVPLNQLKGYEDFEEDYAKGGEIASIFSKAKNFGKRTLKKGVELGKSAKQKTEDAIRKKKKEIALDILWEVKENLAEGRDEKNALEKSFAVVYDRYEKGGEVFICPVGTQIQSLIFDKSMFNLRQAKAWAKKNNFENDFVDGKLNTLRIRQKDPAMFTEDGFRTIQLRQGVQAVIGCPKRKIRRKR